jgi:hypothetical protein
LLWSGNSRSHRFQFDQQPAFEHQIGPKAFGQFEAVVSDRNRLLPFDMQTAAHQLI